MRTAGRSARHRSSNLSSRRLSVTPALCSSTRGPTSDRTRVARRRSCWVVFVVPPIWARRDTRSLPVPSRWSLRARSCWTHTPDTFRGLCRRRTPDAHADNARRREAATPGHLQASLKVGNPSAAIPWLSSAALGFLPRFVSLSRELAAERSLRDGSVQVVLDELAIRGDRSLATL